MCLCSLSKEPGPSFLLFEYFCFIFVSQVRDYRIIKFDPTQLHKNIYIYIYIGVSLPTENGLHICLISLIFAFLTLSIGYLP